MYYLPTQILFVFTGRITGNSIVSFKLKRHLINLVENLNTQLNSQGHLFTFNHEFKLPTLTGYLDRKLWSHPTFQRIF